MTGAGPLVLLISDDDDVTEPLAASLRRAGYRVGIRGGREGAAELEGAPPDLLVLDRDLPRSDYQAILSRLEAGSARPAILLLGGEPSPLLPKDWHEDAWRAISRPPRPGEAEATAAGLLRLGFYLPYRRLVHDLSQPVTSLHALSRSLAKSPQADDAARLALERLLKEAERLMSLMEEFQRGKQPR